jgi:hypothetical protein
MLRARGHIVGKGHLGKFLHGPRCQDTKGKVLQVFCIRHASDGLGESKMDPALGQRCRNANAINKTQ